MKRKRKEVILQMKRHGGFLDLYTIITSNGDHCRTRVTRFVLEIWGLANLHLQAKTPHGAPGSSLVRCRYARSANVSRCYQCPVVSTSLVSSEGMRDRQRRGEEGFGSNAVPARKQHGSNTEATKAGLSTSQTLAPPRRSAHPLLANYNDVTNWPDTLYWRVGVRVSMSRRPSLYKFAHLSFSLHFCPGNLPCLVGQYILHRRPQTHITISTSSCACHSSRACFPLQNPRDHS